MANGIRICTSMLVGATIVRLKLIFRHRHWREESAGRRSGKKGRWAKNCAGTPWRKKKERRRWYRGSNERACTCDPTRVLQLTRWCEASTRFATTRLCAHRPRAHNVSSIHPARFSCSEQAVYCGSFLPGRPIICFTTFLARSPCLTN